MRSSFYNADIIDALAERGRVSSTSTVVDVGTGTGFIAAGLAGWVAHVIGVDNSPAMLAVAASNLAALGADNVTWSRATWTRWDLPMTASTSRSRTWCCTNAPDPVEMLAEMARVVRPGGVIAIADEIEHHYEWMRTEQADLWLGFTPRAVRTFFDQARLVEYSYSSLGMQ